MTQTSPLWPRLIAAALSRSRRIDPIADGVTNALFPRHPAGCNGAAAISRSHKGRLLWSGTVLLALLAGGCGERSAGAEPGAAPESMANLVAEPPEATLPPAPPRLLPVDEASTDPELVAVRESLLSAVRARDSAALLRHVAPDIFLTFGEAEQGAGAFRTVWKIWLKESPVWDEFATILTHGGTFRETARGRQFCAPYVYGAFPAAHDRLTAVAVLEPAADLRSEARDDAPLLGTLEYEIVKPVLFQPPDLVGEDGSPAMWRQVESSKGTGYIRESSIRSPRDYRVCFEQREGVWQVTVFVSGD